MTFIFSYIATNIVKRTMRLICPDQERPWVYRGLVVIVFIVFLAFLYGLSSLLRKPFEEQLKGIRIALLSHNPQTAVDDLLMDTLGTWKFEEQYGGDAGKERFESEFQFFRQKQEVFRGETSEANLKKQFEISLKKTFTQEALADLEFLDIENLKREAGSAVPKIVGLLGQFGIFMFRFTVWFALSMLLSLFITFDLPRITRGVKRLETSRVQHFYHEIAPGLVAFGSIIGRAFQAQGIIAICNTILTYWLIRFLAVPYEFFLCIIVFVCSFVPVLGVVFSTVPIAIIALLNNGFLTALAAVGGVMLIHFIETSVLNPKILGEMLHVHPVLVLTILVIGEYFFGVWGLLLGVPVMVYVLRYVILGEDYSQLH